MNDDSDRLAEPVAVKPGDAEKIPGESSDENLAETAGETRSGNARRVARHKAKLAEAGLKQVNIQAPLAAHPILKDLGRRLKAGQPIEEALFELAALHAREPEMRRAEDGAGLTGRLGRLFRSRSES